MLDSITRTALIVSVVAALVGYVVLHKSKPKPKPQPITEVTVENAMQTITSTPAGGATVLMTSSPMPDVVVVKHVESMYNGAGDWQIITNGGPVQQIRSNEALTASLLPYFDNKDGARMKPYNQVGEVRVRSARYVDRGVNPCAN